ncbi:helix-turn-helix domain-containing protein [Sphingomonas canadensis]|uniref:Helix-turn-helix domain-containing protein n=1 Tax=Sphingomonas canadensis TaxID=1219257 RepID=A0ABW3HA76_9SPHN|nr:helix-turn-helix domain-containing protein [Sphingomonas canadensis]MCW3835899.1 helix-turn-helix domain-containing protein [Sphingomonas canadensis]
MRGAGKAAGEGANGAVPRFYLYGEPHRQVDEGFLHIESLDDRSRPSEWTIRPHAHAQLAHMLHIVEGGGTLTAEGEALRFAAPCVLTVPAGTVHGFDFDPESRGWVITASSGYLRGLELRDPGLAGVIRLGAIPVDRDMSAQIEARAARLARELSWAAPGHRAAAEAVLLELLVGLLRLRGAAGGAPRPGRQAELVARLRERIEQRFRLREPVEAHAAALGVSVSTLRAACAAAAGQSPMAMLDDRALLEARRALLYSTLTVAEIGYALGFADPAYFSRFFARHAGEAPSEYRRRAG